MQILRVSESQGPKLADLNIGTPSTPISVSEKMVSDSELVARLHEFLRSSDLNTTTTAIVRRKLEEDFGIDLSGKKAFIREHVDLFLQSQLEKAEEDEGDGGEEEEEEHKSNVKSEGSNGSDSKDENDDDDDEEEEVEESSNGKGAKKRGLVIIYFIYNFTISPTMLELKVIVFISLMVKSHWGLYLLWNHSCFAPTSGEILVKIMLLVEAENGKGAFELLTSIQSFSLI